MRKSKRYSRLSKRAESQSRRNLILSILGIIIVTTLMVRFGIPLLANISGFISGYHKSNSITESSKSKFISVPTLDTLVQATNSAEIIVKGQAEKNQNISIFINNALSDSKDTKDDGTFSFKVFLSQGENKIKVRASMDNNKSDYSDEETTTYISTAPTLDLKSPSDGQSFSKDQNPIQVTGVTDAGVKVTVNDFWAVIDENNNFSYTLNLKDGDNNIKITAVDIAGNKTEKEVKVTYSP